jgi:preprotein translocase subunit SecG
MTAVILVVHLVLAVALIGAILVQRSEGGALGIGGGGGGGFVSGRGAANFLTRTTAVLAACFLATSLLLTIMAGGRRESGSFLDSPPGALGGAPVSGQTPGQAPAPVEPAQPAAPAVPLSR